MEYEQVIFEQKEDIGIIRLNRPEKKNAFSPKMDEELLDVMIRIEKDPSIRGVLFTGSDDSFSAGLDLDMSFLQTMEESDSMNFRKVMDPILEWYLETLQFTKADSRCSKRSCLWRWCCTSITM